LIPLTLSVKATAGTFNGTTGLGITENAFALSRTIKEDTKSGVNKEIVFIGGW
jgi:hypothetical protein